MRREIGRPRLSPPPFREAFADLYRPAYRAAYRLLGDRAEAEDIAQEACARVHALEPAVGSDAVGGSAYEAQAQLLEWFEIIE